MFMFMYVHVHIDFTSCMQTNRHALIDTYTVILWDMKWTRKHASMQKTHSAHFSVLRMGTQGKSWIKEKQIKRMVLTGKLMQSLEEWETSQLAVVSRIIYLQLTPVMREVLTMSTGGKGGKGKKRGGGRTRNRMTSGRLMLEIIVTISTCI